MSSKLTVSVQQDHLERLVKTPLTGLAELVWNAVDADSTTVEITTVENEAGALEEVQIRDDGKGITPERADRVVPRRVLVGQGHSRPREERPASATELIGRAHSAQVHDSDFE